MEEKEVCKDAYLSPLNHFLAFFFEKFTSASIGERLHPRHASSLVWTREGWRAKRWGGRERVREGGQRCVLEGASVWGG